MLLVEALARVAFGAADERQRPVDDVRQDPVGDAFVVLGQVALGEAVLGIEHAVGMREANAGDRWFRLSRRRFVSRTRLSSSLAV